MFSVVFLFKLKAVKVIRHVIEKIYVNVVPRKEIDPVFLLDLTMPLVKIVLQKHLLVWGTRERRLRILLDKLNTTMYSLLIYYLEERRQT